MPIKPRLPSPGLLLLVALAFLLFFRGGRALTYVHCWDELCYFEWLYWFLGTPGPACPSNDYLPGLALAWLPAGVLGLLTARLTGGDVDSWVTSFVGLTAFALWAATLAMVTRLFARRLLPALVWLLNVPVLYYATSRTTWSHSVEIFLGIAFVVALHVKRGWLALLAAVWLVGTRINDLPVLLVLLAWSLEQRDRKHLSFATGGALLGAVALSLRIGFSSGYNGTYASDVTSFVSWARTLHFLFGSDWGIFWTGFLWMATLALGFYYFLRLSWTSRCALVWMISNALLCIGWRGNGTDFGYRYLIGSYAAALLLWLECRSWLSASAKRMFETSFVVSGAWLTLLTWIYTNWNLVPRLQPPLLWARLDGFQWKALELLSEPWRLAAPLKLSPSVTVACSWNPSLPGCAWALSVFKNQLSGPPLWVLSVSLLVCVSVVIAGAIKYSSAGTKPT